MTEYWVPDSLKAKLIVGAKARVRGFGECSFAGKTDWEDGKSPLYHKDCHSPDIVGSAVTILSLTEYNHQGHTYLVSTSSFNGKPNAKGHYAAIELEPID